MNRQPTWAPTPLWSYSPSSALSSASSASSSWLAASGSAASQPLPHLLLLRCRLLRRTRGWRRKSYAHSRSSLTRLTALPSSPSAPSASPSSPRETRSGSCRSAATASTWSASTCGCDRTRPAPRAVRFRWFLISATSVAASLLLLNWYFLNYF